jgi:hypothetical protein
MTELEGAGHRAAEQIVQSLDIAGREPLDRGATASGDCASVVHALVRLAVEGDAFATSGGGHDRPVNGRERRYHKGVLASEKLGEAFLDVDVDARIAEQP